MQRRLQRSVPGRVVERLFEERDRALRSLELGQEDERLGARCTRRRVSQELERDGPRTSSLSRGEVGTCGGERASVAILACAGGRRTQSVLPQLRCDDRSAACDRHIGRRLELRGDLRVRLVHCKRAMARASERVVDDLGQAFVRKPSSLRRRRLIEHGGEQRVREADHPVRELDHVVGERRLECGTVQLCGPQPAVRAGEQQRPARLVGSPSRRARTSASSVSGTGSGWVGSTFVPEGACELEGEEGIAARRLVEAQQRWPREHSAEPRMQDRVQRARAEWADVHAFQPVVVDGTLELRHGSAVPDPSGEENADVLVRQSPHRERQGADG